MDTGVAAHSMRILYVDDDELYSTLVQLVFRDQGHRVVLCTSAQAADRLLDEDPGGWMLAFVDYRLPPDDGAQVVAALRERMPHLPCLILTGLVTQEVIDAATAVGATRVLSKPLEAEHLIAIARLHALTGG